MQPLKVLSFQKCLDVLEDFQEAVPVDDSSEVLKEKKKQAAYALKNITLILKGEEEGDEPDCDTEESRADSD